MTRDEIIAELFLERERQDSKWGVQDHKHTMWSTILGEEVGEVCDAVLEREFGGETDREIENELIQVAAVCIAWLECIERNRNVQNQLVSKKRQ